MPMPEHTLSPGILRQQGGWRIRWWNGRLNGGIRWNDGMFRDGGMLVSMQNNLNEMLEMLEIESKRIEMV